MAAANRRVRAVITAVILMVVAVCAIALGLVFTSGLGLADAAGRPLDVSAVSIVPSAVPSAPPSAAPTPTPTSTPSDDGGPAVVTGPPPVTIELDDHGGDRNANDPNDNSGHGNSNGD
jgi:hypothetical protein